MKYTKRKWNEQYYHGWKNRYPFTEVVSFIIRNYGEEKDRNNIRILDLGCGAAHHLLFLAKEGFDYYGVDGSSKAIEIAKERLEKEKYNSKRLSVATLDNLPYENDFFDAIIDRGSLVCNRKKDIIIIIKEVKRIMKKSGLLYSMMLHEDSTIRKQAATSLGESDYANFEGRLNGANILHFTNLNDTKELYNELEIQNIEIQRTESIYGKLQSKDITVWSNILCKKS